MTSLVLQKANDETENLLISDALAGDCGALERVALSWSDKKLIEGYDLEKGYFEKCINQGDLPPVTNANKRNYRLKAIYLKKEKSLIGFFDLYYGYHSADCVWISIFVIDSPFRKQGYAQEVISFLKRRCKSEGFLKIGIGVYLNNWRALRFWTKAGFVKIMGVNCDGDYQKNKFATIKLELDLK